MMELERLYVDAGPVVHDTLRPLRLEVGPYRLLRLIDCHSHLEKGDYYREVRNVPLSSSPQDFVRLSEKYPYPQFIVTPGTNKEDRYSQANEDVLLAVNENHSTFFGCLLRINPNYAEELEYAEKAIAHETCVLGYKVVSSASEVPINDPKIFPIVESAIRWGVPVLFHCGRWKKMSSPSLLADLADRYPDGEFVMGHMGGASLELAWEGLRVAGDHENVLMDTSSCFFYKVINVAVEQLGAERILFGSDYPYYTPMVSLSYLNLSLPPNTVEQIKKNPYRVFPRQKL